MESKEDCLTVNGFGAAFGTKVVLADIEFALAPRTLTVLMGPSGSGKSTLLHALAGTYGAHPRYRTWGDVRYLGQPLAEAKRPRLVQQQARTLNGTVLDVLAAPARERLNLTPMELRQWCVNGVREAGFPDLQAQFDQHVMDLPDVQMRAVAILNEAAAEPGLLMVDEPTTDLSDYDAYLLIELLRHLSTKMTVLVVLHHQKQARQLAGRVLLLAGGRIQEHRDADDFFNAPISEAGMQFIRSGSCSVASPQAQAHTLADGVQAPPPLPAHALSALGDVLTQQAAVGSSSKGPTGFLWIVPGKLAGAAMPGAVTDIDHDLTLLKRVGITMLITLTERDIDQAALQRNGLKNLHLPVYDREAPSMGQIQMLLKRMEVLLAQGEVLAVHCLGGLGRTGTVIAAWLVREGLTAQEALRRVRRIDPRYVQSADQEVFLQSYEEMILQKIV
ncbi:ATP-binding cassette domain-containing protein [Diaphorobacter sp.]|uniref:phosphatase domain-containing putative toxin n=1 Tax=Diaphorobacter sp. TaxID=1934310 RepID=UPI0028A68044|nr:ATP-binding cassette domain-containing protein [Diaphorobacter sp.]